MKKNLLVLLIFFTTIFNNPKATKPVYICTAADDQYFACLINLIGSLHKHNFDDIAGVAVFDLGLTEDQKTQLAQIEKLEIKQIEITHPDLLTRFNTRSWGKPIPGWYAWKAVIVKQAFDIFGTDAIVFWIDAGTTIQNDLNTLFAYTQEHGYFFHDGSPWPMKRQTTQFVINAFNLHNSEFSWIVGDTSGMEAGFMGLTYQVYENFIYPMYLLTYDLRFFADDGTCPNGFGECRHDQTLFSIFALKNNYHIFHHFKNPLEIISLPIKGQNYPFHIACNPQDRIPETTVYRARFDVNPAQVVTFIRCKKSGAN